MITLTEEQFKEMIEAAHRAGQHNQGHCDPSAYEAMVYYEREVKKLIIPDVSGSLPYNEKLLIELWYKRNPCHEFNINSGEDMFWETAFMVFEDYVREVSSNDR